jgi:hypothetical protein
MSSRFTSKNPSTPQGKRRKKEIQKLNSEPEQAVGLNLEGRRRRRRRRRR